MLRVSPEESDPIHVIPVNQGCYSCDILQGQLTNLLQTKLFPGFLHTTNLKQAYMLEVQEQYSTHF